MGITFVRSWKWVAFRGIAAVLFGLAALLWAELTLPALVVLFGMYALVDGAVAVGAGVRPRSTEVGWLVEGLLGMAFGLLALLWIGMTLPTLVSLLAFWAITTGSFELFAAVRVHDEVPGELSMAFAGAGSLLLGILLLFWPAASALVPAMLLGSYAMLFGASMLVLAWQLRKFSTRLGSMAGALASDFSSTHVKTKWRRAADGSPLRGP